MPLFDDVSAVHQVVCQLLSHGERCTLQRAHDGHSTAVYRVCHGPETLYLRILPEQDASFAPEAYVHRRLRAAHVHVPDVLAFEHCNAIVQRSTMLTTAIAGRAVGYHTRPLNLPSILRQAGHELAVINTLPVDGFGWIQRPARSVTQLQAEHPTFQDWLSYDFAPFFQTLEQRRALTQRTVGAIRAVANEAALVFASETAVLAHGDFDPTHIFHHDGAYTGIIDFGEIRGAQRWYDMGHFAIENGALLPHLLEGYAQVAAFPPDYMRRIQLSGLLIAAGRLGRRLAQHADVYAPDVHAIERFLLALDA